MTCETCLPFMRTFDEPYTCQCSVANCASDYCDNYPCTKCTADYATIFVDRSTELYTCSVNQTCDIMNGLIVPQLTTDSLFCKNCKDSNCANCLANSELCDQCKSAFFTNTTLECQACSSNCL